MKLFIFILFYVILFYLNFKWLFLALHFLYILDIEAYNVTYSLSKNKELQN